MPNDDKNFYHMMLGLPQDVSSPNYYELLGLELFEDDEYVIRDSAISANQELLKWQNSEYHGECDRLLDAVANARDVLIDPQRRSTYDKRLRERLGIDVPIGEDEVGGLHRRHSG